MTHPRQLSPVETRSLRILQKTYELPILSGKTFQHLYISSQKYQNLIRSGQQESLSLFGFAKTAQPLTLEQRLQILDRQVKAYKNLIKLQTAYRKSHQRLLYKLTHAAKQVIVQKCQQLQSREDKRITLESKAKTKQDADLLQITQQQKWVLVDKLQLLDKAAILVLQKIDLVHQKIQQLVQDNKQQKRLFNGLVSDLRDYKEAYQLQQELGELDQLKIDFERYVEKYLEPLQQLLKDAAQLDQEMAQTIEDVCKLAEDFISENPQVAQGLLLEAVSESLLNFQLRRDCDRSSSSLPEFPNPWTEQTLEAISISDNIQAIKSHVEIAIAKIQNILILTRKPLATHPSYGVQSSKNYSINLGNSILIPMVCIPRGSFLMGSPTGEGTESEKPQHPVTLSEFYISQAPITNAQWQAVMHSQPALYSEVKFQGDRQPVINVTWYEVQEFCQKLSQITQGEYRLPSEAEWEYACRAGSQTQYFFGHSDRDLADYAWYHDNSEGQTHPVGQKQPNPFGLYDMHGNVLEYCADHWHDDYTDAPTDGSAWITEGSDNIYVIKGGSWTADAGLCRSAYRSWSSVDFRNQAIGFRIVYALPKI